MSSLYSSLFGGSDTVGSTLSSRVTLDKWLNLSDVPILRL